MVPMVPAERDVPDGGGLTEDTARPLVPPTVTPCSSAASYEEEEGSEASEQEDFFFDAAVDGILREVEDLRKGHAFPGLETFDAIDRKRDTYLGPTMESNWVLPGRFLVGAYPASMNDSHHAHLLCTILLQGVSTFVCLQQEYRTHGVTEAMWRSGEALRPYFQDVLQLLRKLRELKAADPRAVPAISAPDTTDFVHFPIVDCNVADDTKVLQLAAKLAARVAAGEVLYLHCWGGHGRTGTVVSIMLHLMYDLSAGEAMERCQYVHDVRRIPISVGSPQTEAQRDQVRRVIWRLERRSARAAAEEAAATLAKELLSSSSELPRTPPTDGENVVIGADDGHAVGKEGVEVSAAKTDPAAAGARRQPHVAGSSNPAAAAAGAVVGGRRGWVRGRRQAFAQAPNGVGEDVSGWLMPTEEDGSNASVGSGKTVRVDSGSVEESGADGGGVLSGRRKSFAEPGSSENDEASRDGGGRATRLRRKSAPGQSPRSAEVDEFSGDATKTSDDKSENENGTRDGSKAAAPVVPRGTEKLDEKQGGVSGVVAVGGRSPGRRDNGFGRRSGRRLQ